MDDLARARVEFALLEEKARDLLKELLGVRAALAAQRAKIGELIRTKPSAINYFPTELLLSVLDLTVHISEDPGCKQQLASVCRRWRDIVSDSPSLWTTIHVAKSDTSSIRTHLERSRGAPLNIVIKAPMWALSKHLALVPSLDVVGSCAHRWNSLLIGGDYCHDDDDASETTIAEFIIKRINQLHFPSLKSVAILTYCDTTRLDFLSAVRAPALENLDFEGIAGHHIDFLPVTTLKILKLDFFRGPTSSPSFPHLIPALTDLSLTGFKHSFTLQPNSIRFPSLKVLELSCIKMAGQFLDAIVAPSLEQFKYVSADFDDPPSVVFGRCRFKFASVRHLFCSYIESTPDLCYNDAMALCEAFPGVRHMEYEANHLPHLFHSTATQELGRNPRRPIDVWTEFESLKVRMPDGLEPNEFPAWLVDRRALGLRLLHVKLSYSSYVLPNQTIDDHFALLYEPLKQNCILELENVPLMPWVDLRIPANSLLKVVSASHATCCISRLIIVISGVRIRTGLMNDLSSAFLVGNVGHD